MLHCSVGAPNLARPKVILEIPYEVVKCQMQYSKEIRLSLREAASRIYNLFGIRGFYRGLSAHLLRDIVPFGIYFWSFERIRSFFESSPSLSLWSLIVNIFAGGSASVMGWLVSYPVDSVKSRMQASLAPFAPGSLKKATL